MKATRVVNVTGHPVSLTDGVAMARLDSEGRARVHHIDILRDHLFVDGLTIPLLDVKEQKVYGLPDEQEGVIYVVSGIVQAIASSQGRDDVVTPGRLMRDGKTVVGARALIRVKGNYVVNQNSHGDESV